MGGVLSRTPTARNPFFFTPLSVSAAMAPDAVETATKSNAVVMHNLFMGMISFPRSG
jgi:hypothetical protein